MTQPDKLSSPCALALRDRCTGHTVGLDPCRVCLACQAEGKPARVDYSIVVGRDTSPGSPTGSIVIGLANAGLSEMAVHPAADPKVDVGSFAMAKP